MNYSLFKYIFLILFSISIYAINSDPDNCFHPSLCNLDGICNYPIENYTSCPSDCNCYTLPDIYNCFSTPLLCNYDKTPDLCNCSSTPSIYNCTFTPDICNYQTTPSICNCYSTPSLYNCTATPYACNCTSNPDICNYQLTPSICNCDTDPLYYNCQDTPEICCPNAIKNGNFTESFNNWFLYNENIGIGNFTLYSENITPDNHIIPYPYSLPYAIVSYQGQPSLNIVYQQFMVPLEFKEAILNFKFFSLNYYEEYIVGNNLELIVDNQYARIDIIPINSPIKGVDQIIENILIIDQNYTQYTDYTKNLSNSAILNYKGEQIVLRFAEIANKDNFNFGIDNISFLFYK